MVLLKMSVGVVRGYSIGGTLAVSTPLHVEPCLVLEVIFRELMFKKKIAMTIVGTLFLFVRFTIIHPIQLSWKQVQHLFPQIKRRPVKNNNLNHWK
jgi:hypothetical protein